MKKVYSFISCLFIMSSSAFSQNVGVGITTPAGKLHIKGAADASQLIIDANSTQSNTAPLIKLRNSLGNDLMWIHSDDATNIFMGFNAGRVNNPAGSGIYNSFIGRDAGYSNTTGNSNTAYGYSALRFNTTGYHNTANGLEALYSNTTGNFNSANGYAALFSTTTGLANTASGHSALVSNTTGFNNTSIGYEALKTITTGNNNTAIGYGADVSTANISNATALGSKAYAGASNSVVIGSINGINGAMVSTNVGIGTSTPNAKLHVNGTLKIVDGSQGAGKILTSDATGLASWQPPPPPPAVNYPVVWICCNPWMTKNLDVSTYRNGDPIPKVTDAAAWAALTTGAYCYYNNDSTTYAATYGKLYNWYAVNDSRGLAPEGWHIPTDFEWTTLGNCLGGDPIAGGPMKEIGTTHWTTPNTGATNLSGFTGLPGGYRNDSGLSNTIGTSGNFWSFSENNTNNAWWRSLGYDGNGLYRLSSNKRFGFSVRCLRD